MKLPSQMEFVASPPPLWATVVDVLVEKIIGLLKEHSPYGDCPPYPPGGPACPLKPDGFDKCPGEEPCWILWAYQSAVARMATDSTKQTTDLQGKEQP